MSIARWLGVDITTSELALAVRSAEGEEGYAAIPMAGATYWNNESAYPGFDLSVMPGMMIGLLETLESAGWQFDSGGALSVSCRQHDMVLLGGGNELLCPAISWQCNAARAEAEQLNADQNVVETVGRVEPRLILPKLIHTLKIDAHLKHRLWSVMTTGDWLAYMLTGEQTLHTSELRSNGIWDRGHRKVARKIIKKNGLDPEWFPKAIRSGDQVGTVQFVEGMGLSPPWRQLGKKLAGWSFIAGLGDNHASAVGCGVRDSASILVSAGTSGTVNWALPELPLLDSGILGFSFYDLCLWLLMLGDCGAAYNRFLAEFFDDPPHSHSFRNGLAQDADLTQIQLVGFDKQGEFYRSGFSRLSTPLKIASMQCSIVVALLKLVQKMRLATPPSVQAPNVVLTGGLSQSMFFQQAFEAGVTVINPQATVKISGRTGPLRYKTTAYGALVNAQFGGTLTDVPLNRFPLVPCAAAEPSKRAQLRSWLREHLSA